MVERVPWTEFAGSEAAARIVSRGEPVVLTGCPVFGSSGWPAMSKWRIPGYLPSQLSTLTNVKRMPPSEGAGLFATQQPMAFHAELMSSYHPHYSQHNMTAIEFFQHAARNDLDDGAVSFAARLDTWPELLLDVSPTAPFVAQPLSSMSQTFIWVSQAGTLTPCHHDHYHNFYILLEGVKHFLLLPPSSHRLLYLHPSLHPAHRSSQVFVERCREGFPLARDLPAKEVILQPGEVLYIPALWFHHVKTLNFSVAVNVWSIAESEDIYSDVLDIPLPMPAEGEPHAIQGLRGYLLLLLQDLRVGAGVMHPDNAAKCDAESQKKNQATGGQTDSVVSDGSERAAKEFIRSYLLESRYLHMPSGTPRYCEDPEAMKELFKDRFLVHAIGGTLSHVVGLFKRLEATRGSDIMALYLSNYIEYAIYNTVGVQQVSQFLRDLTSC